MEKNLKNYNKLVNTVDVDTVKGTPFTKSNLIKEDIEGLQEKLDKLLD